MKPYFDYELTKMPDYPFETIGELYGALSDLIWDVYCVLALMPGNDRSKAHNKMYKLLSPIWYKIENGRYDKRSPAKFYRLFHKYQKVYEKLQDEFATGHFKDYPKGNKEVMLKPLDTLYAFMLEWFNKLQKSHGKF